MRAVGRAPPGGDRRHGLHRLHQPGSALPAYALSGHPCAYERDRAFRDTAWCSGAGRLGLLRPVCRPGWQGDPGLRVRNVLSFSRMLFVEFTTSMSLLTLLACHMQAFGYFGGVTKSILYDNMKQVSIRPGTWNALFLDFAGYYGFSPRTCRIRRPRTKGKVERMVAYIKDNFLAGRSFAGLTDLNTQARHWLEHTANVRVHATTGKWPADLLAEEKLCPVNTRRPYALPEVVSRKVDRESFVSHSGSRYMVAPEHVGKQVQVYCYGDKLVIRSAETILAQHKRATSTGQTVADKEHVSRLWELCAMGEQSKQPPSWQLNTGEQVATRALAEYEEVVA